MKRFLFGLLLAGESAVSIAAGRITIAPDDQSPNPIDAQFDECLRKQSTTLDWDDCVRSAHSAWTALMETKYRHLLKQFDSKRKTLLMASQATWESAMKADLAFLNSYPDLRQRVGSGGYVMSAQTRMPKVKERALDLSEYDEVFAEQ